MRMRGTWIVGALAMLAACPGEVPVSPDGQPDGASQGGLTIEFRSDQPVPGMTAPDRTIDQAEFHAASVRAFGDAAPGDLSTTENDVRIRWQEGDEPDPVRFDRAPVGLYASVEVRMVGEGSDHAYEIRGQANVGGIWQPYEVNGDALMTIAVPTSTELPAGGSATITVDVALPVIIAGIDFSMCPLFEGELDCEAQDDMIAVAVAAAFGPGGE